MAPHLTNTSLQIGRGDAGIRLLTELLGCSILSKDGGMVLEDSDIEDIMNQTANILADAFRAALASPVHFQVGPIVPCLSTLALIFYITAPSECIRAFWSGPPCHARTPQDT